MTFQAKEVNAAFAVICPELTSKYAQYPIASKYQGRWLAYDEKFDGKPVVILMEKEQDGIQDDYVYCKNAPLGRGYYHVLTKVAYVNLYTRLMAEGSGSCCGIGDTKRADQWDTARRIVYNRSRASRPDDVLGAEQAVDHMAGTKLNPVHALKL